jgi:wobble nucleotide-excising tRNase
MPREKNESNCQHCGKELTRARKDQKYCSASCRFEDFFKNRETLEERLETLTKENVTLRARNSELEAQLQTLTVPRKSKAKVIAS